MSSAARHFYFSPHLDDAVLSCGGRIAQQQRVGEAVTVVSIFAGRPDLGRLSPFAEYQHALWGHPTDPFGQRRQEDSAACAWLGARVIHLDYQDVVYRRNPVDDRPLVLSDDDLFGRMPEADWALVDALSRSLAQVWAPVPDVVLYAPLAAGNHVDHQVIRQAALRWLGQSDPPQVWFYEDYPYVQRDPAHLVAALAADERWAWQASRLLLTPADLEARVKAIGIHHSQMDVLFGGEAAMVAAVERYAWQVGDGRAPAERVWRPMVAGD